MSNNPVPDSDPFMGGGGGWSPPPKKIFWSKNKGAPGDPGLCPGSATLTSPTELIFERVLRVSRAVAYM